MKKVFTGNTINSRLKNFSFFCHLALIMALSAALFVCGDNDEDIGKATGIPRYGVVTGENISVRMNPHPTAPEVDNISEGATVRILKRGRKRVRIGSYNAYWYYIEMDNGIQGWTYGGRLNITGVSVNAKSGDKGKEEVIDRLAERIVGQWWEIRSDGSTGYRTYLFWSEGDYKYGYGSGKMTEGKYELLGARRIILLDKGSGIGDKLFIKRMGRDLRLYVEYKGRVYTFRKGSDDPESGEIRSKDKKLNKKKM